MPDDDCNGAVAADEQGEPCSDAGVLSNQSNQRRKENPTHLRQGQQSSKQRTRISRKTFTRDRQRGRHDQCHADADGERPEP